MNEKIKQLAEQAGITFSRELEKFDLPEHLEQCNARSHMIEDFAELIVKECIDVGLEQKKWVEDQTVFDPRDENWNRARIQQSQHIVDKIKEHFGVEE